MSNKSGISSQVISVPDGGGAIKGIGETFSPDLFTGTGNFTVPIAVPPGRNGFQPELNLVYSSGNGIGPFGCGWTLNLPNISRKTSKGVPKYLDNSVDLPGRDAFMLSGADELVQVTEKRGGVSQFKPRCERFFSVIEHIQSNDNDFWSVRTKDGLVNFYGTAELAVNDTATITDPKNRSKIFSWHLTQTVDPFGNRIAYTYLPDADVGELRPFNQLYLQHIRYIDYDKEGAQRFLVSVEFVYEEQTEQFSDYRSGFEIRTRKRCKRIEIHMHPNEDILTRTFELIYIDERVKRGELPEAFQPLNGAWMLSQIQVTGHDGTETEQLPPLEFGYSLFEPTKQRFQPFSAVNDAMPLKSLADENFETVDLFGDGLPDIIQMNGFAQFWRNLGNGKFDEPFNIDGIPAGIQLSRPGVLMADLNGNGRADLLDTSQGGYFPMNFRGQWSFEAFVPYNPNPRFLEEPDVRLVDLDGNGVVDALRIGTSMELFFNDPERGWLPPDLFPKPQGFPNTDFSDLRVKLGDLTGDGLQDLVFIEQGSIQYFPCLGHGKWGTGIIMKNSPVFHDSSPLPGLEFDPARVLLGDVDGDGLDDIVHIEFNHITIWINQGGNGWSKPIPVNNTPLFSGPDSVRLADMLGNGMASILWTTDNIGSPESTYQFLDLSGGAKPYLLTEMNNNVGAITKVKYAPSTKFYLDDQKNTNKAWITPLPFPVQVVETVEIIDAISQSKVTTQYKYHHGYWDGAEREFRGFGSVEQSDTETFERFNQRGLHKTENNFIRVNEGQFSPPMLTKTWFHLGPIGDEFEKGSSNASNKRVEADFSKDYWTGDTQQLERPDAMTQFIEGLSFQDRADALRTLRGSILRTELYANDGTLAEERPFTVTEALYGISEVMLPGDGRPSSRRIFFPHLLAQRTTQWERGNDPMTSFTFTDDYDSFGQARKHTQIACPRGWRSLEDTPVEPYLATHSRSVFASPPQESDVYLVDSVARSTSFEVVNDGLQTVLSLRDAANSGSALSLIGQTLNFYDGLAFIGLPNGESGEHGALVRTESLVLTEEILKVAYKSGDGTSGVNEIPPYLELAGLPPWTDEYPQEFRTYIEGLPKLAGFTFHAGDNVHEKGYFATSARKEFDFQVPGIPGPRGLLRTTRDPLGSNEPQGGHGSHDSTINYDQFDLLPIRVIDPAGLVTEVHYDERILQPVEVTDPNGNRTHYAYTPLGLLKEIAVLGKIAEFAGDEENLAGGIHEVPSTSLRYDFLAFANSSVDKRIPVSVHSLKRVHHVGEKDVTNNEERNKTIELVEYSDGFGRLLQTRTLAEDDTVGHPIFGGGVLSADQAVDPVDVVLMTRDADAGFNVVVSGAQVYDNKGRVVEKFEPYFELGLGFDYRPPGEDRFGQRFIMFYDPLGRVIRTLNPDGSERRIVHGVPGSIANPDLSTPDMFEPTPWEAYTYDANDLAPISRELNPDGSPGSLLKEHAPRHHHFTPSSILVDALGRTVLTLARNRQTPSNFDSPLPPVETIEIHTRYDIRGNALAIIDSRGREAFTYVYDLANNTLRTDNIDAGVRRTVLDGAGNEVERRDSKGTLILGACDRLQRPIRVWARDDENSEVMLRERLEYGDGGDPNQDPSVRNENRVRNRLGALHRHYDEAGMLEFTAYDFKGNVLEKFRRMIRDEAILAVFPNRENPDQNISAFRVNWDPFEQQEQTLLAEERYETSATYDALNRPKLLLYPRDVQGGRKELRPTYNRAGGLESVTLGNQIFVEHIAYDAKGQRIFVAMGNRVMTLYAYETRTFRLSRMFSTRFTLAGARTFRPEPLTSAEDRKQNLQQDFGYDYDLAGNIVRIRDRTPESGILNARPGRNALDRTFEYDAIYRLIFATGREADRPSDHRPDEQFDPGPRGTDLTRTRAYTERYHYDLLGNLEELNHSSFNGWPNTNAFVRSFEQRPGTNQLATVTTAGIMFTYSYDQNGNMTNESSSRHFEWDHSDRMKVFRTQVDGSEPSVHVHYLYDASGERVKKLVRKQNGLTEVTDYIDGIFEHHRWQRSGEQAANNRLHVMDDQRRIALVRIGDAHPDDKGPEIQYLFGDHLGSSNVVINADGTFINHEEFTPYGETSFGSFVKKQFRFTGKEREEESGLNYHNTRYYASWLGRWTSPDPGGPVDGPNLYAYVRNNPLGLIDPNGNNGNEAQLFFSEASAFIRKVAATAAGRGFTREIRGYFSKLQQMWGGPARYHISHVQKPFSMLRGGEISDVGLEEAGANLRRSASERVTSQAARSAGQFARTGNLDTTAVKGTRYARPPVEPIANVVNQWETPRVRTSVSEPNATPPISQSSSAQLELPNINQRGNASIRGMASGFFGSLVLAGYAEILSAGLGWNLEARERGPFRMTRKQTRQFEQERSERQWEITKSNLAGQLGISVFQFEEKIKNAPTQARDYSEMRPAPADISDRGKYPRTY